MNRSFDVHKKETQTVATKKIENLECYLKTEKQCLTLSQHQQTAQFIGCSLVSFVYNITAIGLVHPLHQL